MSAAPKVKQDLTPIECKEHLDEVLEMEAEVHDLEAKMNKAHENFKDHKGRYEVKRDELLNYLKGLNEEHPLFDDKNTIDIPFPFPVPDDCKEATLANVAADPVVLGLSVSVVKSVREKINCSTLGQVEKWLNAGEKMQPAEQTKAKKKLGDILGPNSAMKLLRAIASFTGNRTKQKPKKGKATRELIVPDPDAVPNSEWRDTKVADLQSITPMQAQLLGQLQMPTVGKVLAKIEQISQGMPAGSPPDYVRKSLAAYLALTPAAAGKIVDAVFAFEEENLAAEGKVK